MTNDIFIPFELLKLMLKADRPSVYALHAAAWAAGYTVNGLPA